MNTFSKRIKYFLFIFPAFYFFFNQKTNAQNLIRQKTDALSSYIDYQNFISKQLFKSLDFISESYKFQTEYELNSKILYDKQKLYEIAVDDKIFNNCIEQFKNLDKIHSDSLTAELIEIHKKYSEIYEMTNVYKDYMLGGTFKKDKFNNAKIYLQKLSELYKQLSLSTDSMNKSVYEIYRKIQPVLQKNIYHFCEEKMRKYLNEEYSMLRDWSFNLSQNHRTFKFPFNTLIRNINENDLHFWDFDQFTGLPHSVNYFYISFFTKTLFSMQEIKRQAVDNYTEDRSQNDLFSNTYYKEITNFRNSQCVKIFNDFAAAAAKRNIYILKYPELLPDFVIDTRNLTKVDITYKYIEKDFEPIKKIVQKEVLSEDANMALNNFVEYINKEVAYGNLLTTRFRNYNQILNEYYVENLTNPVKDLVIEINPGNIKLARSEFEKAMNNCRFLPSVYRKEINFRLKQLFIIVNTKKQLAENLDYYIKNNEYIIDNFERAYEILKEFEKLHYEFDIKSRELYYCVRLIYDSFPAQNPQNSGQITYSELLSTINKSDTLLREAKKFYRDTVFTEYKFEDFKDKLEKINAQKDKNTEGLNKPGSKTSIPLLYQNITEEMYIFLDIYKEFVQNKPDTVIQQEYIKHLLHYNGFVEDFNNIVIKAGESLENEFNEKTSPVLLLKQIYEPDIFRFVPPPQISLEKQLFESMDGYAPNNLVLLLDVSMSMKSEDKLPLLKTAFIKLLEILREEDFVSIVTYSGTAKLAMETISCSQKEEIKNSIENLISGGGTKLQEGLKISYKTASENFIENGNNRVILATDGEFVFDEKITKLISKYEKKGIKLSIFHFGKDKEPNELLQKLSTTGNGNYELITQKNVNIKIAKEAKAVKLR